MIKKDKDKIQKKYTLSKLKKIISTDVQLIFHQQLRIGGREIT